MSRSLAARVAELRSHVGNSEVSQWPTCLHCMQLSELAHPGMGANWVPVDGYRIDPETVFKPLTLMGDSKAGPKAITVIDKLFAPRERDSRGWLRVIGTCHGKEAVAEIDVPLRWGTARLLAEIKSIMFFGQESVMRVVKL